MSVYEYYIKFIQKAASAGESSAYINQVVYVAYTEGQGKENWITAYSYDDIEGLSWLDDTEKAIIKGGFDNGLAKLYLRGAVSENWGQDGTPESPDDKILLLENYLQGGIEVPVDTLAFTLIMSPRWSVQSKPDGFSGVLVNSIAGIPTNKPPKNVVNVYDPIENGDMTTMDGKALGIMARFLSQSKFSNMQLSVFNGYKAIAPTGLVQTLKDLGVTFLFDDGINHILGMLTAGGLALTHPYISELWKFNVRENLRKWMQIYEPTYINENILTIEDIIDKVSEQFKELGYFGSYTNTVAPLREAQLASDIDQFLVNNVEASYVQSSAIWGITTIVTEDL